MRKEVKRHTEVGVGIGPLWKCLSKDLCSVMPKVLPNLVETAEVVEGDGGLGSVFLFTFSSSVPSAKFQKEKIVLLDESTHRIGLQVIEGGHLNHGFSYYTVILQLTATAQKEKTAVDVTVEYELDGEERVEGEASMPLKTVSSSVGFIECLGDYLLSNKA